MERFFSKVNPSNLQILRGIRLYIESYAFISKGIFDAIIYCNFLSISFISGSVTIKGVPGLNLGPKVGSCILLFLLLKSLFLSLVPSGHEVPNSKLYIIIFFLI